MIHHNNKIFHRTIEAFDYDMNYGLIQDVFDSFYPPGYSTFQLGRDIHDQTEKKIQFYSEIISITGLNFPYKNITSKYSKSNRLKVRGIKLKLRIILPQLVLNNRVTPKTSN